MRTILEIYFAINILFAGYYLGKEWDWARNYGERIACIVLVIGISFLGIPYLLFEAIVAILSLVNHIFQLKFWWKFFFTKKYNNLSISQLEAYNGMKVRKPKNLADRILNFGIRKINERNNYKVD